MAPRGARVAMEQNGSYLLIGECVLFTELGRGAPRLSMARTVLAKGLVKPVVVVMLLLMAFVSSHLARAAWRSLKVGLPCRKWRVSLVQKRQLTSLERLEEEKVDQRVEDFR